MADTNNRNINNNNNNNHNASSASSAIASPSSSPPKNGSGENKDILSKISQRVWQTYEKLALERAGINSFDLSAKPISGVGENSYGLILQVTVRERKEAQHEEQEPSTNIPPKEMINILKISPKNPAFRAHSRIADLYKREVFLYERVFKEFRQLHEDRLAHLQQQQQDYGNVEQFQFDIVPELLGSCLAAEDEFIIFEDLSLSDHKQNLRTKMPTFDLVAATFRSVAKFHAMSFILQAKKPEIFQLLIKEMSDNLFIENVEPITIEFGKKYIRKTRVMLQQDAKSTSSSAVKQIDALQKLENNFKRVCLQLVNGKAIAPYAVICHGDFWNNNMLYKYDDEDNEATSAKLIDFQLSRYASPVLDLVHYLYTCTEKDLRKKHFQELLDIYYQTLSAHIQFHELKIEDIYPKEIFSQHLKEFGIFGFCMSAFAIPFFISNSSELPNLDEVATAIRDISSSSENSDEEVEVDGKGNLNGNGVAKANDLETTKTDANTKRMELLEEYDLLTERTLPIFKRRMCGIVRDLEKYNMLETVLKL